MIDFAGPWEVFQDVMVPGQTDHPFRLYTVSESTSPIHTSGGMKVVPDYNFENAPAAEGNRHSCSKCTEPGNTGMDS